MGRGGDFEGGGLRARAVPASKSGETVSSGVKAIRIGKRVVDVTEFASRHPGGKVIEYYLDQDATDAFTAFHFSSEKANKMLEALPTVKDGSIAATIAEDGASPLVADFRVLVQKWKDQGLYDCDYALLAYRMFEIVAIMALSFYFFALDAPVWVRLPLASLAAGVGWTRCGWIQHDGGHIGITGNTAIDHGIQAVFEGFVKGGSASWWRNRHNKHHAKCNVQGKDTDLNTYPLLCWDLDMAKTLPAPLIAVQHLTFFPLLAIYVPIFFFTTKLFMLRKKKPDEALITLAHFATFVGILRMLGGTPLEIVSYFFFGYVVQGLYLGFCFSLSHFAMPQIKPGTDDHDWVTNAVMTTLNTTPTPLVCWTTGHLNLQIEHHLCPTMPTHNLLKIKPDVEALCAKHGLKYQITSFWNAAKFTVGRLREVANQRRMIVEIVESD